MKTEKLTRRQYFALCSLAVLSPALRLLPRENAALAGSASWLCGVVAYVPLLLFAVLLNAMLSCRRAGEGMGDLILRALGNLAGKIVLVIYALWFLLYAAFLLRSGAERFVTTVYPFSGIWPFVGTLLALSLVAALGGAKALFRAAEVFLPLLTLVLVFVLLFALPELNPKGMLAVSTADIGPVLLGTLPILNIGAGILFYPTFFEGLVPIAPGRGKATAKWLVRVCLLAVLLSVFTIGMLGAELTANLSYPFFTMLRNVSIFHAVERFEALVVGLWVLPDFILIALMLMLASGGLRTVFGCPPKGGDSGKLLRLENGRILIWICALAALVGGLLLAPDAFDLEFYSLRLIPGITLGLTIGGTSIIFVIGKLRKTL